MFSKFSGGLERLFFKTMIVGYFLEKNMQTPSPPSLFKSCQIQFFLSLFKSCPYWKAFSGNERVNLDRLFQRAGCEGTRGHGLKLSMPRSSTEPGRRLLGSRCVFPWNALPADVVESESLYAFKRKLDAKLGESVLAGEQTTL